MCGILFNRIVHLRSPISRSDAKQIMFFCTLSFQKQVNGLNKVSANLIEMVNSTRDQWENDMCEF